MASDTTRGPRARPYAAHGGGTVLATKLPRMSSGPHTSQAPLPAAESHKPSKRGRKRAAAHVSAEPAPPGPPAEPIPVAVARPHAPVDERRKHERASVRMLVQVVSADRVATYMAENLSAGGALLLDGPELPRGTELSLALKLRGDTWHVRARVVRVERDAAGRMAIAVAFPSIVPRVQDLIQSHVLGCLRKNTRSPS